MTDFDRMTRTFILGENKRPSLRAYLSELASTISKLRPSSQTQAIMIENLKSNLREVKKEALSLEERVKVLEEHVVTLEESKKE
jgi:hypothetical protein